MDCPQDRQHHPCPTVVEAVAAACTALMTVLALVLALVGCSALPASRQGGRQDTPPDDRFAEFTADVLKELDTQERPGPVASRMPGLEITAARWKAYQSNTRFPSQGSQYDLHAVLGVSPHSARVLHDASVPAPGPLPAVHPDLYRYVPRHCTFTSVPAEQANQLLLTDRARIGADDLDGFPAYDYFSVSDLIVSSGCNLAIVLGLDWKT